MHGGSVFICVKKQSPSGRRVKHVALAVEGMHVLAESDRQAAADAVHAHGGFEWLAIVGSA